MSRQLFVPLHHHFIPIVDVVSARLEDAHGKAKMNQKFILFGRGDSGNILYPDFGLL